MKKEIKIVLIVLGTVLLVVGFIGGIIIGLNKRNDIEPNNIINNVEQTNIVNNN